jgi:hypothetical protein
VCCRYLTVASKGWCGYGRSRCGRVTSRCMSTSCSGRNSIIPLMRRSNTDSTPKKPVMLKRNQHLIRYAVTGPVHAVTIRYYHRSFTVTIRGNVTSLYPPLRRTVTVFDFYKSLSVTLASPPLLLDVGYGDPVGTPAVQGKVFPS